MGKKCSIKYCKNYQKEPSYGCDISFHGLPRNEEARRKWLEAIPQDLIRENANGIYICSAHFTPESFQPASLGLTKNMLRRTAIPSIFLDAESTAATDRTTNNPTETMVDTKKVNFVNASNTCVYVITKMESSTLQSLKEPLHTKGQGDNGRKETCDVGIQVSLPSLRERELQRKLYVLQKKLERREARISAMMTDFKTLMDQS